MPSSDHVRDGRGYRTLRVPKVCLGKPFLQAVRGPVVDEASAGQEQDFVEHVLSASADAELMRFDPHCLIIHQDCSNFDFSKTIIVHDPSQLRQGATMACRGWWIVQATAWPALIKARMPGKQRGVLFGDLYSHTLVVA